MGTRADQKEKRRQQILFCSLDLFVHRGYNGTTVRDIAAAADMSVGLLFHYFPTKQAILEELIGMAEGGVSSSMTIMNLPIPPIECFEQIAGQIFNAFNASPLTASVFMLVNQTLTSDWVPESIKKTVPSLSAVERTIPVIIEGQRLGTIRPGDPSSLALAFWGAIQGIAEALIFFPDIPVPDAKWIVDILRVQQ